MEKIVEYARFIVPPQGWHEAESVWKESREDEDNDDDDDDHDTTHSQPSCREADDGWTLVSPSTALNFVWFARVPRQGNAAIFMRYLSTGKLGEQEGSSLVPSRGDRRRQR